MDRGKFITSFGFSNDEKYLAVSVSEKKVGKLYVCHLENGMEHDLFVDQEKG